MNGWHVNHQGAILGSDFGARPGFISSGSDFGERFWCQARIYFGIVDSLEKFFKDIDVEKRVEDLVKRFLQIPTDLKIERDALKKLNGLYSFLRGPLLEKVVSFEDNKKIKIKRDFPLVNDFLEKTALFAEVEEEDRFCYTPQKAFEPLIHSSGFFRQDFKPLPSPEMDDELNKTISDTAGFFGTAVKPRRRPIFLLGAGTSLKSGAPDHMLLIRKLVNDNEKKKKSEEELLKEYKRLIKEVWTSYDVRKRVIPLLSELKPGIGHFYLAQLIRENLIDIIITTNYDTLIEDSLMDFGIRSGEFVKLVGCEKSKWIGDWVNDLDTKTLKLFKICGDLFYGEAFALKTGDANRYIETAVPALEAIIKNGNRNMFIIIGHGLKERAIYDLLFKYSNSNTVVVYVKPSPFRPDQSFKDYVDDLGVNNGARIIEIIHRYWGMFDNFMEKLFESLKGKK